MRYLAVLLAGLFASCSSEPGLPTPDVEADSPFQGDVVAFETLGDADATPSEACEILWQMRTFRSGAMAHPALGKQGVVYIAAYQKLYALDSTDTGKELWVWPDGDTQSGIGALEEQLYSPAIGLEGSLVLGSGLNRLLVINKNGVARWAMETEGPISGAPAISADQRIVALTDTGALYLVRDMGQNKPYSPWSLTGANAFANPMTGVQPLIGRTTEAGHETVWVLTKSALHVVDLETGESLQETPLPAEHTAMSNLILDASGGAWFLSGTGLQGDYYDQSWVWQVDASGAVVEGMPKLVTQEDTKTLSLSQGTKETLLIGSSSRILVFSLKSMEVLWTGLSGYQDVAQPAQAEDGTIYFGAWPHWIEVYAEGGTQVWEKRMDDPDDPLGAQFAAASPLILEGGTVLFHNGNVVSAVHCSDAGPAKLSWPRFGGNDRNTGNLADSAVEQE